jgi:hypothetical protein
MKIPIQLILITIFICSCASTEQQIKLTEDKRIELANKYIQEHINTDSKMKEAIIAGKIIPGMNPCESIAAVGVPVTWHIMHYDKKWNPPLVDPYKVISAQCNEPDESIIEFRFKNESQYGTLSIYKVHYEKGKAVIIGKCTEHAQEITLKEFGQSTSNFEVAPTKEVFDKFQRDADKYHNQLCVEDNHADLIVSVMIARISQKYNWPITSEVLGEKAKEILIGKSKLGKYVSDDSIVDDQKLDIWWASFFVTEDNIYLEKIFRYAGEYAGEDLKKLDNKRDAIVYAAANWSFKSNCQQHEKVRLFAEEKQKNGTYSKHKMKYLQECSSSK